MADQLELDHDLMIMDHSSISIHISNQYRNFIKSQNSLIKFNSILLNFFKTHFSQSNEQPKEILFTMLTDPESNYEIGPAIKIFYNDSDSFHIINIKTDIEQKLKENLLEISESETEFISLRKLQKEFPIFIRRC